MLTKEKQHIHATVSIRVVESKSDSEYGLFPSQHDETENRAEDGAEWCGPLFEFAGNAPVTFAERFPRVMVGAVAIAFIMAAIAMEIDCLRAAGYYWQ
ncbi:hypothetical protein P8935_20020 [Telmatobacter sp. DSM 110680]|uniref:Uncharacterized protein n=1 Tax=Telmatobacter sp. DSM 110680 TaxID=3036704 RepID=A0AAU7DIF4_9BACT